MYNKMQCNPTNSLDIKLYWISWSFWIKTLNGLKSSPWTVYVWTECTVYVLCVFSLTLFLPPLGLSSSQVEVEMLHSDGVKGDALPVCRTSRRAVFPCLGGPMTSIFSSLQASAFRRCARRKARTDAGPDKPERSRFVFRKLEITSPITKKL